MNLVQRAKESKGYFRLFSNEWNQEMKERIKKDNLHNELGIVDLPFRWGNLRYIYLKEHENSEIVTVMFKIPMNLIPYEELWSKWGKRRRKQLAEFLMAWLIKERINDSQIKIKHVYHTYVWTIVSVPKFLKSRLFSHLSAF